MKVMVLNIEVHNHIYKILPSQKHAMKLLLWPETCFHRGRKRGHVSSVETCFRRMDMAGRLWAVLRWSRQLQTVSKHVSRQVYIVMRWSRQL
ncbi:hypothetical protein PoB_002627100 [Plakobranchus ocellatus]|uniref:Uncharacterized protein n=1 Tax=Plakobranchus ocellatus TaxID=259542 RepID=A0AAV3ZUZ5_9GAST|nr:hypothetical protein PoB_002627100 [Plakobranchus ocellatus]